MMPMTTRIFRQLLAIRDSGETNMIDRPVVQMIANREGFYELVVWLEDNPKGYGDLIFNQFAEWERRSELDPDDYAAMMSTDAGECRMCGRDAEPGEKWCAECLDERMIQHELQTDEDGPTVIYYDDDLSPYEGNYSEA